MKTKVLFSGGQQVSFRHYSVNKYVYIDQLFYAYNIAMISPFGNGSERSTEYNVCFKSNTPTFIMSTTSGPLLLTRIQFNPSIDTQKHQ